MPVASFTDAWIETLPSIILLKPLKSHLLQMRGLKLCGYQITIRTRMVASFTDAWIETLHTSYYLLATNGRIFYRCVD